MLNDNVRITRLVKRAPVVPKDGSGVHALVYLQEGHPNVIQIVLSQSPEAAVCIAVLRTNPWVHDECALRGDQKNAFLQEGLATSNDNVWSAVTNESFAFGGIRAVRVQESCVLGQRPIRVA